MKLPIHLLVLDFIGCILIGLGMAMHFANIDLLPESLRFEKDGLVFIVVGVALMLPAILHLLQGLRKR
ncbi:DUF1418 family protein [Gilvimarinus agarilyticus]|uniref:DUF1418 family protein n=1 Tax=unclassified Gilvimarinus TaxID=2642066 RepID=UPI001C0A3233|nr:MULTISPECIES: DUF1418 family protein [unclassified Gilvimarinus]MBU2885476.1 DUF1418 family protein [Gilvimarinus agarilyticus]MDO6570376.1 DUF1418 family protein [Gilvimarinus sp. 2_MG-2023]MDO6748450.1 DUF1418 family protein [Gilvimarinus sp. 1_MG-2023]